MNEFTLKIVEFNTISHKSTKKKLQNEIVSKAKSSSGKMNFLQPIQKYINKEEKVDETEKIVSLEADFRYGCVCMNVI